MNRHFITAILAALLAFAAAFAQPPQSQAGEEQKHEHIMQMMEDSAMMRLMLEHIATHRTYRQEMMRQMVRQADRDSVFRQDMMQMMMNDPEMQQHMERMMQRGPDEWNRMHEGHQGRMMHDTTRMQRDTTGTRSRESERDQRK